MRRPVYAWRRRSRALFDVAEAATRFPRPTSRGRQTGNLLPAWPARVACGALFESLVEVTDDRVTVDDVPAQVDWDTTSSTSSRPLL